jgi:pseudouridine kinase
MSDSPNPEGPILVIGASGIDIVGRSLAAVQPGVSNPGRLRISHGGVARNLAENLQRLGADTILITATGEDFEGRELLAQAAALGVDVQHAITVPDKNTGAYLAVLDADGTLGLGLDDMQVTDALSPDHLRACQRLVEDAGAVVVDANLPPKSLAAVVRMARQAGVPVAADPTSRSLAPKLLPHLSDLWLISPNEAEAATLCVPTWKGDDPPGALESARHLVSLGVQIAIVSRAEFGVSYASASGSGNVPAIQTDVLDPTGAGDALLATVVFAQLNDIPLDEAVRLGVTAAALTLRTQDTVAPDLSLERLYDELI